MISMVIVSGLRGHPSKTSGPMWGGGLTKSGRPRMGGGGCRLSIGRPEKFFFLAFRSPYQSPTHPPSSSGVGIARPPTKNRLFWSPPSVQNRTFGRHPPPWPQIMWQMSLLRSGRPWSGACRTFVVVHYEKWQILCVSGRSVYGRPLVRGCPH